MDISVIIILGIILFVLILLNSNKKDEPVETTKANCSQTMFGCCPDGVNSKINHYGTNCPAFRPGPGYGPAPNIPPPPGPGPIVTKPIGGCAGTIYGCCSDNQTPKIDEKGSNCFR